MVSSISSNCNSDSLHLPIRFTHLYNNVIDRYTMFFFQNNPNSD
jgi:hypothetical protein